MGHIRPPLRLPALLTAVTTLGLWAPPGLDAQPIVRHTRTEYYDVRGNTPEDLRRAMLRLGPVHEGERVYGRTDWTLRWRYSYEPHDRWGCTVTRLDIELETVITLPRWDPPRTADPEVVRAWGRFIRALEEHEEGHRTIADAAAREARRRLRRVRAPTCSLLGTEIDEEGQRIIAEHERRSGEYDEETARGRTQGAVWPPPVPALGAAPPPLGSVTSWVRRPAGT